MEADRGLANRAVLLCKTVSGLVGPKAAEGTVRADDRPSREQLNRLLLLQRQTPICIPFLCRTQWDCYTMGLVLGVTGAQSTGLAHSGTNTQSQALPDRDTTGLGYKGTVGHTRLWDTGGLQHKGTGIQRDCNTKGLGHNGTVGHYGTWSRWESDTTGLGHNGTVGQYGTGTKRDWATTGLGHRGPPPSLPTSSSRSPLPRTSTRLISSSDNHPAHRLLRHSSALQQSVNESVTTPRDTASPRGRFASPRLTDGSKPVVTVAAPFPPLPLFNAGF